MEYKEKQIEELKNQVDELKFDKELLQKLIDKREKDTAKEILHKMLTRSMRLREQFDSTTYGTNREHLIATIEIEIEGIKNLAKRYGVEVE